MKKILALLILTFCIQGLASAAPLNWQGKSVTGSTNSSGVTGITSAANGARFTSESTICSADGNCVNFTSTNGSVSGTSNGGKISFFQNSSQLALQVIPSYYGWQYQSFGVWANTFGGNTTASAGSFGSYTVGSSIPKTGSATYTGLLAGLINNGGPRYFVAATMSAGVNFSTRQINFLTTNSLISTSLNGTYTSNNALNLHGTLSYAANTNSFSGTVTNTGDSGIPVLSGTASGQFYGPAAQEIGGVISMRSGSIGFIGGFGGKK